MNKENTRWASDKPMFLESLRNKVTNNNVAVSQAKAFAEEILSRARGKIPSPYLETLLIYHPDFLRQPAEEFIRGYRQSFNAKGHQKSKGASFTIKFPSSWMAKEGERPNIVQTFISEGGRGLEMATILTKSIPLNIPFTQSDIVEILSPAGLKEMVPKDAKVLNSKSTKIEGDPAGIIEYVARLERAGAEIDMHALALTFFQGRTMIQIQFQVSVIPLQNDELTRRFATFRPLFNLMMNNIVFVDKWKKP